MTRGEREALINVASRAIEDGSVQGSERLDLISARDTLQGSLFPKSNREMYGESWDTDWLATAGKETVAVDESKRKSGTRKKP